jgi:hypothetical protein
MVALLEALFTRGIFIENISEFSFPSHNYALCRSNANKYSLLNKKTYVRRNYALRWRLHEQLRQSLMLNGK